jgi:hypothetical protein
MGRLVHFDPFQTGAQSTQFFSVFISGAAALASISSSISCSSQTVQPFEILMGFGNSPKEHSLQMVGALRPTFSTTCRMRRVRLLAATEVMGLSSELRGGDHRSGVVKCG